MSEDWGMSNNFFLSYKLNQKWAIESRSLAASRNDFNDYFFSTGDLGFSYRFTKHVKVGASYRVAWWRLGRETSIENRPLLNFDLSDNFFGYNINNRSRFEFRFFNDDRSDDVRLRNETRIIFPYQFFGTKPYLEEELFYSFRNSQVDMNWLSVGLRYGFSKKVKVKLGYRWSARRVGSSFENRNVLVTGVLFFF